MTTEQPGSALLCGLPAGIADALAGRLTARGLAVTLIEPAGRNSAEAHASAQRLDLGNRAAVDTFLDAVIAQHGAPHVLVNHVAIPLTLPALNGRPLLAERSYAPDLLYRRVLQAMPPGGNIVNAFGDTGDAPDPWALTLPILRQLNADLADELATRQLCMNAVSLRPPGTNMAGERTRIEAERVQTMLWLATLAGGPPQLEVFRGYSD